MDTVIMTDYSVKPERTVIPESWKIRRLGDLITINSGESPSKFNLMKVGLHPYVKVQDMNNCAKYQGKSRFYVDNGVGFIEAGSIIFPKRGAAILNNKVRFTVCPIFMDSNMMALTVNNKEIDKEFLFYKICEQKLLRIADTSTIPQINNKHILPYKIALPPFQEQQKIAKILTTWDEAIDRSQQHMKQLVLRKRGLMQQLLRGKIRLPGFSGEWKEEKLGSYFKERKETGYYNLPLLSVGKNGVYPQDLEKKDTSNSDKSKYKRICNDDIGYNTMRMWQGRSAISNMEGIVSPAYTILQPRGNSDTLFFSYLFKLESMVHKFYRNSQGMVSDTWMCKFKDLALVKFDAPSSIEEQKAIAAVLITADKEIEKIKQQMEILRTQKKGLMQQLLTGKKRVKI